MIETIVHCDFCFRESTSEKENYHRIHIENQNLLLSIFERTSNVTSLDICDVCLSELLENVSKEEKSKIEINLSKELIDFWKKRKK